MTLKQRKEAIEFFEYKLRPLVCKMKPGGYIKMKAGQGLDVITLSFSRDELDSLSNNTITPQELEYYV